jgi:hypothetical protein
MSANGGRRCLSGKAVLSLPEICLTILEPSAAIARWREKLNTDPKKTKQILAFLISVPQFLRLARHEYWPKLRGISGRRFLCNG